MFAKKRSNVITFAKDFTAQKNDTLAKVDLCRERDLYEALLRYFLSAYHGQGSQISGQRIYPSLSFRLSLLFI